MTTGECAYIGLKFYPNDCVLIENGCLAFPVEGLRPHITKTREEFLFVMAALYDAHSFNPAEVDK